MLYPLTRRRRGSMSRSAAATHLCPPGRVVPASDLPSELAGHAVEGFDAVGGSEASFQNGSIPSRWRVRVLQAFLEGSLRQTDSSASVRV